MAGYELGYLLAAFCFRVVFPSAGWRWMFFLGVAPALLDGRHTDVVCDDAVELTLQYSTQWDSLAHMGQMFDADGDGIAEMVFYNGFRAVDDIAGPVDYRGATERNIGGHSGARALGIEHMAERCVQGRGVMIDFAAHLGESAVLVG